MAIWWMRPSDSCESDSKIPYSLPLQSILRRSTCQSRYSSNWLHNGFGLMEGTYA